MISKIRNFLRIGAVKTNSDFSDFFINASSREQKKVLTKVLKKANLSQQELMREYQQSGNL